MSGTPFRLSVFLACSVWVLWFSLIFGLPHVQEDLAKAEFLTRQTARVAVAYWGGAVIFLLLALKMARWFWVLGSAAFLVHVLTAFAEIHEWSHRAAFAHVEAASGFGAGIFVSYVFTLVWFVDACWWLFAEGTYRRRANSLNLVIHLFMAFIVFNGTVIYEAGLIRWAAASLFICLGVLVVRRWHKRHNSTRPQTNSAQP